MNIFKDNCLSYLKAGFSITPAKGKKPLIKQWAQYCKRQCTKDELDEWVSKYPNANIDICLGEQSKVIVLDFDEIDPELVSIIEPMLPASPVERIGKKGFVRFFQYSGEPTQNVWVKDKETGKKRIVLEVLSNGKKVTIPPSIHPDTKKPYEWTDKSLLDVSVSDLPKFPPMLVAHLQSKLQCLEATTYGGNEPKITEGRNISLSTHVAKLIKSPHTILGAVQDLIEFDINAHDKPLFNDLEDQEFKDPKLNSLLFYTSHLRSINQKRVRENKDLELPILASDLAVISRLIAKDSEPVKAVLPKPSGLLLDIYNHILDKSYIEQPAFAISASMALLGTLASRKFIFQNTTPNLYLLNIAESGSGKDSCQQVIKDLLCTIKADKLLGATAYPSEASIINNLDINPVRLDVIDECSSFLSSATKGGASYAMGIGDTLCELYSCSNSFYLGKSLASTNVNVGAVHRPHINLMCSTTPRGISEGISISSLEKGLFARFITLFGNSNQQGKRIFKQVKPSDRLLSQLTRWYEFKHPHAKEGNFTPFNQPIYKIPCTATANTMLTEYYSEFDKMRVECKANSVHRPIISRLFQHMLKIVMISAIGNTEDGKLPIVKPLDVDFGYKLITYYYEHILDFIKDNLHESARGMKLNKVLNIIKEVGDEGISNAELTKKCKFLTTFEKTDIIKDLKESNRIDIKAKDECYIFYYLG